MSTRRDTKSAEQDNTQEEDDESDADVNQAPIEPPKPQQLSKLIG